jgi:PilZ domain
VSPPPTPDRRQSVRFRCPDFPEVQYLLHGQGQTGRALLRDLSAEGVGLLTASAVGAGTALLVQLPGAGPGTTSTQLARVAHATPQAVGDWLIGCRLTPPLSSQDLDRLRQLLTGASG